MLEKPVTSNTTEQDSVEKSSCLVSSRGDYGEYQTPPPPPEKCEYCGKALYHIGMKHKGIVIGWVYTEKCDCEGAVAYRAAQKEAQERRLADEENRLRKERAEKLLGKSGMGKRFQQRTFANFICSTEEQRKCLSEAQGFADNFVRHREEGTGLFIAGSVGTGKTHLAAAIALQLLERGIPVVFKTVIEMLRDIRRAFNGESSEQAVIHELCTIDLLVLDDLGKEKMTEWAAATLYDIVNARYENMLPTIVTTNFTSEELLKSFGDEPTRAQAILSRLMETSSYISMKWADYRTGGTK